MPALVIALLAWFEFNRTVSAQETLRAVEEPLPYKYYGNSFSHKFHRPSCPFGMCISKSHLVRFHFRKEAIEAHFVPCKYCLPPIWWSVHGVILQPKEDSAKNTVNIPTQKPSESQDD